MYPIVEAYRDRASFGWHADFSDPLQFHELGLNATWTPQDDLPEQGMVAILAIGRQSFQKHAEIHGGGQNRSRLLPAGEGDTGVRSDQLQHGGIEDELPDRVRLRLENLFIEIGGGLAQQQLRIARAGAG